MADLALGTFNVKNMVRPIYDISSFYTFSRLQYVTRNLVPLPVYDQYVKAFDVMVWLVTLLTMFVLSVIFRGLYWFYKDILKIDSLYGKVTHPSDFFLLTFSSLTEPDPLPWFPKWSTGKSYLSMHKFDNQIGLAYLFLYHFKPD